MNLGRDIVVDSQTLGRCYVPTDWLEDEKNEIQVLCVDKNPRSLGDEKIMKYSSIMLELANRHLTGSIDVVRLLPYDTRISVLVLVDVFWGVASAIQSSSNYPTRALPSTSDNILLGLYTLYVKSVLYIKWAYCIPYSMTGKLIVDNLESRNSYTYFFVDLFIYILICVDNLEKTNIRHRPDTTPRVFNYWR